MTRSRVAVVFGTRPEAIKLAPVVRELRSRASAFDPVVITTSQHREMLDQVIDLYDLQPDVDLDLMRADQSPGAYGARALEALTADLARSRPDAVLVQGDTTTAAMAALAAFYEGVLVGHVEAGLRSFDRQNPFPEEVNRRMVGVIADLHFAPTARAAQHLLDEGQPDGSVFVTGNTIVDALSGVGLDGPWDDRALEGIDFEHERVLLVTAHRRESHEQGLSRICAAIAELAALDGVHVVYPVHLNPRVQTAARELADVDGVHLVSPLSYRDLLRVLSRCTLVLTDSGGLQEEAPSFHKPVLVLRDVTERQELIEHGAGVLVGTETARIVDEATRLLGDSDAYGRMASVDNPFGDGKAAIRIVDILGEALGARAG